MSVVASLIIIVFLVALSAFFAGSETALTAASTAKMHNLEKQGEARARLVNKIRQNKEHMIGSLLMGNTLVNILASALATSTMIKLFDEAGVIYATIIITIVVLIFAEVLPKTFAFHHADKSAMFVARPASLFIKLSTPATAAIVRIVRLLLKLFGGDLAISTSARISRPCAAPLNCIAGRNRWSVNSAPCCVPSLSCPMSRLVR